MRFLFVCIVVTTATTAARSQTQDEIIVSNHPRPHQLEQPECSRHGYVVRHERRGRESRWRPVRRHDLAGGQRKLNATTDSVAGVPVRLDLLANEVDIRAGPQDVRAAKASTVRYVDVNNRLGTSSRFINVREYRGEADALSGFFEQLITGRLDLLQHPTVYIRRANYNMALNVGTKDDEIIKKTDWYIAQNKRATKFSPGKRALLDLMSDRKEQIEAYLKKAKPDLKTSAGLTAVVAYYNSL